VSRKRDCPMAKSATMMSFDELRKKYDHIDCFFTYYNGEKSSFDFYGTDANGTEVRISIGGCPAWIKTIEFGPKDPINISDSIETIFRRLDDLNPPKEVIEIKNGLKQSIENIKVLWKYHINAINDIIKLKNNNDNEKSIKECVGEFTIKIISKIYETNKRINLNNFEIERNNKELPKFYLNGGYIIH
jgi:hypothetical protein